jgi:hypothetical protein
MPDESQSLPSETSANHRRVISVRVRVLEDACLRLLDLFRPHESSLTSRSPLPPESAAEIERLVAELSARIARIKSDLNLEQAQLDARREASALASSMTVDLEELHPRYLRGYGKLPPGLASYLENWIRDSLGLVEKVHRELNKAARRAEHQGE